MKHIITISCALLYFLFCSHTLFEKTIGQQNCYDEGVSALEVGDGNFLVSGAYNCTGNSPDWKGYLVFLNEKGDTLWSKKDLQVNGKVRATHDGNFVFIGGNTAGFVYDTIQLFKSTLTGNIIWKKSIFYTECKNTVSDILPVPEGFILTGFYSSSSCSNPVYNSFILKLDHHGNKLWEYLIEGSNNDQLHTIKQMNNGSIAAFGWTDSKTKSNDVDYLLVKLNSKGNLIWTKTYGNESDNYGYGMDITETNGFVITGYTQNMEVLKLNNDGNKIWTKTYGPACGGRYYQAQVTSDGGYTFLGSEYSDNSCKSLLIKTDKDGKTLWKKTFNGKLREFNENSDSSFILTGYLSYLPNIYVIKFDSTKVKEQRIKEITTAPNDDRVKAQYLLDSLDIETTVNEQLLEEKYPSPKLYPNPAENYVEIQFNNPEKEPYTVEIFNINGSRVASQSNFNGDHLLLHRRNLIGGLYTYKLTGAGKIYCGKFLFK